MSAIPEPAAAIGYAYNIPAPPPPAAVAALLAHAERVRTETGTLVRPLPDADPAKAEQPEGGALFTRSEARAIQCAADGYQRAEEAHAQAAEGLARARKECDSAAPPPTPPEVQRAAALAYLERPTFDNPPRPPKLETSPADASAKARRAAEARVVIDPLRLEVARRADAVAVARGELRTTIIRATDAARRRAAAKWHAVGLQVAAVAGELDGLDRLMGELASRSALDPFGVWHRTSQLMAPPVEMRPPLARVQECMSRECVFLAESPQQIDAAARVARMAEAEARTFLADAVPWPFP